MHFSFDDDILKSLSLNPCLYTIDRSINVTINLNNNRCNHKHCHVFYCQQLICGEISTYKCTYSEVSVNIEIPVVIYC